MRHWSNLLEHKPSQNVNNCFWIRAKPDFYLSGVRTENHHFDCLFICRTWWLWDQWESYSWTSLSQLLLPLVSSTFPENESWEKRREENYPLFQPDHASTLRVVLTIFMKTSLCFPCCQSDLHEYLHPSIIRTCGAESDTSHYHMYVSAICSCHVRLWGGRSRPSLGHPVL